MKTLWNNYRYLFLRRLTQIGLLFLYFGANAWGWTIIQGNLSSSLIFGTIPMSDPYAALQMLFAGAMMATNLLIGVAIATAFYFIIGGRAFCSWVCPINMVTDAASFTRDLIGMNKLTGVKQPASRNIRYWMLALSLILSAVMGVTAFEFISPISMVHRGLVFGIGFGWAAVVIIFLFDLFVLKNGWCGHICPLGGFYSILGKFSLIRVKHTEENCTLCMKCKVVCPENQVLYMIGKESLPVLSGECTNCARCIEVCDDDALNFSIRSMAQNKKTGE